MVDFSAPRRHVAHFLDSDLVYSFLHSWLAMISAVVTLAFLLSAAFAPVIAPHDPYDLTTLNLLDAFKPPAWVEGGTWVYPLGTDDQGRDILSTIMFGSRISLLAGLASVVFAGVVGVAAGLVSGFVGGKLDAFLMRAAEVQLTFPAVLIALLIDGVLRGILPAYMLDQLAIYVVVLSIGVAGWPQYARTVRASTMVEKNKEYVLAANVIGVRSFAIVVRHVLPNVMGPVLVIATIYLAIAIILEATLSFLGVGIPPTEPSLGTMIRIGNDYLFSGEWWITLFPGAALAVLVLAINLLGDWLRDALNPKLR